MFHHQGSCPTLVLSYFTIRTILTTDLELEQKNRANCRSQKLVRRQSHLGYHRPALFVGICLRGLLLVSKVEGTAGWPLTDPGEPQEDLGRGQQNYDR